MNQEEEKTVEEIGRLLEKLSPVDQAVVLQRADSYLMEQNCSNGGEKIYRGACEQKNFGRGGKNI